MRVEQSYAGRTRIRRGGRGRMKRGGQRRPPGGGKTYISLHCYVLTVLYDDRSVWEWRKIHLCFRSSLERWEQALRFFGI